MHSRAAGAARSARAVRHAPLEALASSGARSGPRRTLPRPHLALEESLAPASTSRNPIAQDDLNALKKLTKRTIKAAAKGAAWPGWKQPAAAEDDALWRDTGRPTDIPSEKKEQFMATSHSDTAPTILYGDSEDTYIRPGSFVELRRSTLKDTKPTFASLTASGEVFTHDASDSMWVSPDFVTPDIVEQCGIGDAPETAAQHSARVHVVRQLRRFERKFERKQSEYGSRFPKLYDELRNPDPAEWAEVKTADVAAKLKGSSPTVVDGLAAHRLLMDDSFHYLAHPRAHRVAQSFLVRPLNDVRNHERVIEMFRDPDNAQIESFVRKAKGLLQFFSEREKSAQHPPRPVSSSHNLPKFDEDDQRIILFLRQAAMSRRSVQRDWYLAHAMRLLKKVAFFTSGKALTHSDVFTFLKAIGVAAPWEDESWTMPHMYALSKGAPGSSAREQRHEQLAQRRPTPEAALTLTPNADEFYPRDIMQDLRSALRIEVVCLKYDTSDHFPGLSAPSPCLAERRDNIADIERVEMSATE
ncbi:hypothetical protein EXIGLDRAFT_797495 [Exidia glandulosa HHB12029]|uniref:Uncharacterized protein n=1 Tax=Exidia glandulosa HHB12029 TaxID=1314781 RepID=A0A165FFC7_EXIGL|nr:hypothetical protein EXIGLDRAFT_797495 [Exidia glandulosa HHB12029]